MWSPAAASQRSGCAPARGCGRKGAGGWRLLQRILQTATECLFFLFFFLKNSSYSSPSPNKHLASHTAQPGSLPRILQQAQWCWAWGFSHVGPHTGPRYLIVLKHSPYRLIFQCCLQFLVSSLLMCWNTVGCSLCSSEDQLGVPPERRRKWTQLLPISPPSSSLPNSTSICI